MSNIVRIFGIPKETMGSRVTDLRKNILHPTLYFFLRLNPPANNVPNYLNLHKIKKI